MNFTLLRNRRRNATTFHVHFMSLRLNRYNIITMTLKVLKSVTKSRCQLVSKMAYPFINSTTINIQPKLTQ